MKFKTLLMVAAVAGALQAVPAAAADIPNAISPGIASKMIVRGTLEGVQVVDLRSQRKNDVMVVQAELQDRKSTRLNSSHSQQSRMPSSA